MIKIGELLNIHNSIADSAYRSGMKLLCNNCKNSKAIDRDDFAEYMARGWPTCCGKTMELITKEKENA